MGKHTLDAVLSIGGDILAPFTGGASALIGNGLAAGDEALHGNPLGAALSILSGGLAGGGASLPIIGSVGEAGQVAGSELASAAGLPGWATEAVSGAAGGAAAVGTGAAESAVLDPILQRTLGLSSKAPSAPPTTSAVPPSVGGGGGAGPSAGPGGLNITGGSAPQIYPYTKQSGPSAQPGAGGQPQARGI